jgi:ufm1-conjugating enzyme 1
MEQAEERVKGLPLLSSRASPRDHEWNARLKEEYRALISLVKQNNDSGAEWFKLEATEKTGCKWSGTCWFVHEYERYEFNLSFELSATYPLSPPPLALPELDGKTEKMYRGGAICLDAHFQPQWSKNFPNWGIAHSLALGLAPWLAAEVPSLVAAGKITPANKK